LKNIILPSRRLWTELNKISWRQFLDKPEPYYVVDVKYEHWTEEVAQLVSDVLHEQSTGWYYSGSSFHAFENPQDCDLVKGVLGWKGLTK
jgi:hypothetical protein